MDKNKRRKVLLATTLVLPEHPTRVHKQNQRLSVFSLPAVSPGGVVDIDAIAYAPLFPTFVEGTVDEIVAQFREALTKIVELQDKSEETSKLLEFVTAPLGNTKTQYFIKGEE